MLKRTLVGIAVVASGLALANRSEADPLTLVQFTNSVPPFAIGENTSSGAQTIDQSAVDIFANFGALGIQVTGAESNAVAAFRDEWTVTGGSGQIEVQWSLDGSLTLNPPAAICTTCTVDDASVTLRSMFGSTSIFSLGTPVETIAQVGAGSQSVSRSGSLFVNYVSGQMFGAGFRLGGGTGDDFYGGSLAFLNTAALTAIILPDGAVLSTTSGAAYNVVRPPDPHPVPEPSTLLLVACGLLALRRRWTATPFPHNRRSR